MTRVVEGQERMARQKDLIARLRSYGHSTLQAETILSDLEQSQPMRMAALSTTIDLAFTAFGSLGAQDYASSRPRLPENVPTSLPLRSSRRVTKLLLFAAPKQ